MIKRLLFLVVLFLVLAGFGAPATIRAQENRRQIVASTSVLADVVGRVAGDAADVTSLVPPGADPHAFEPTPQDLALLAEAAVVFVNGANFEGSLAATIENAGEDVNVVPASLCVPILPFGDHTDEAAEAEATTEAASTGEDDTAALCAAHDEELAAWGGEPSPGELEPLGPLYALNCEAHEGEEEAEGEAHEEHGTCDPHVWLDPRNVMYWTLLIRDTLIDLDPGSAETYTTNAAAYLDELSTFLQDEMIPLIETLPFERRVLVTDHDLFGYFANAYNFRIVGVVVPGGSTVAEPSAAEMAALIDAIRAQGVPAIFVAATVTPTLAQRIADETGATVETLYTHSVTAADGPAPTYIDMMRVNAQTIVEALNR